MLLHHSLQDVIDGVREFTRPHPGKDVGKLQLPTLTGIQDYEKYSFQLYAVLEGIGICDIVKEMVKSKSENRQYMRVSKEADRTEGLGDDIVYVFQTRVGTHSWEPRRLNRRQAGELVLLGPQIISGKNFAHSIDLVFKNGVKFLPEIIAVWDQHYGQTTTSNEMENVIRFFSGKKDKSNTMGDFVAQKFALANRLKSSYFTNDAVFQRAMATAILMNLPERYAQISSEIRANPPGEFREIERRLIDFDQVLAQDRTSEIPGKSYHSNARSSPTPHTPGPDIVSDLEKLRLQKEKIRHLETKLAGHKQKAKMAVSKQSEAMVNLSKQTPHATSFAPSSSAYPPITCFRCGKLGHRSSECRTNMKGFGYGKGGIPKKGAGKGGKKGGKGGPC